MGSCTSAKSQTLAVLQAEFKTFQENEKRRQQILDEKLGIILQKLGDLEKETQNASLKKTSKAMSPDTRKNHERRKQSIKEKIAACASRKGTRASFTTSI